MPCPNCGRGFHEECENGCDICHTEVTSIIRSLSTVGATRGAPMKEDPNDPYSTGRKRAAVKYPLYRTNPCEWRGKKNCGGGIPIVGCLKGKQTDRHHGPIKDPLHNEKGNVHRICKPCHNGWHAANDSEYDEAEWAKTKHEPEPAEELELLAIEAQRKLEK